MTEMKLNSEMEVSSADLEGGTIEIEPVASCEETSSDVMKHVVKDETVAEISKDDSSMGVAAAALSSEAIVAMWNDHYNRCYWYTYELYVQEQVGGGRQQLLPREREEEESQDSEAMESQDTEVRGSLCMYMYVCLCFLGKWGTHERNG